MFIFLKEYALMNPSCLGISPKGFKCIFKNNWTLDFVEKINKYWQSRKSSCCKNK